MLLAITTPAVKKDQLDRINEKTAAKSINDEDEVLLCMSGSQGDVTAHAIRAIEDCEMHQSDRASTLFGEWYCASRFWLLGDLAKWRYDHK